jgi:hypothetical protein
MMLASAKQPALRRFIAAIEPWYDWGATSIERLEGDGEGPGYWLSLEWLGLNFTVFMGRTPPKRES